MQGVTTGTKSHVLESASMELEKGVRQGLTNQRGGCSGAQLKIWVGQVDTTAWEVQVPKAVWLWPV